ncbi:Glutaredoxin [Thalictrum thalictroides]|uniref:Glutaredoxin n=1 Tax=Thalictrum thalictroides TaxID=46969 RepID=A0A7J6VZT1_THATH|nr:Glutaredoxin [Thalictrum thalictroides]
MERVARLASSKAVVIFSKSTCCMCTTIKSLFSDIGVNALVLEIDQDPKGRELERALLRKGCNPSVPAVFIGGELIGGANEVMACHLNGSLRLLLKNAGAIWL